MTLIVCSYVPTGIAVSGDSRTTLIRTNVVPQPTPQLPSATVTTQTPWVLSDSARKVFVIHDRFAVATWGEAFHNEMPIAHHISEFSATNQPNPSISVEQLSDALLQHMRGLNPTLNTGFLVAGYDENTPSVYELQVPANAKKRWNVDARTMKVSYGVFYGGDYDILARLLSKPETNPPFSHLNLQDAVDLTRHFIRTTIDQMRFEPRFQTVGGHIDTITLTSRRTRFLVRKELRARDADPDLTPGS